MAESGRVKAEISHQASENRQVATGDPEHQPQYDMELAARFKAAWAYARIPNKAAAAALGVSERTYSRMTTGATEIDDKAREITVAETGVPAWFIAHGFDPPPATEDPDLLERTKALEEKVETLYRVLVSRQLSDAVSVRDRPSTGEGSASGL